MTAHDNNNFDETKLTAYALGELDATETAQVETYLADNPDAAKTVDDIRRTADLLEKEFATAPALTLTDAQRDAIEEGSTPRATAYPQAVRPLRRRILRIALSAAAVLIVGFGFAAIFLPTLGGSGEEDRLSSSDGRRTPGHTGRSQNESGDYMRALSSELVDDTHIVPGSPADPSAGIQELHAAGAPADVAEGRATRESGRININTASPEVLACLEPPASTLSPARPERGR